MIEHKQRRSEAFFGRRQAKPLRDSQILRTQNLLPDLRINIDDLSDKPLGEQFAPTMDEVRLEIGFGGGEHLIHEMARSPHQAFIGVEPFINGMAKFLSALEQHSALKNRIRLYDEDATQLLDALPAQSLVGIDLFYPDPWHKKKHWKRRFVNHKNLERFKRVLKPGGYFRFASDIESYVNWTLAHIGEHKEFEWLAQDSQDWHQAFKDWPGTRYENKAFREGRVPAYLTFKRISPL